jgi:hypothetical protein
MTTSLSTKSMQRVLTFPFEDPKWKNKFLLGIGLSLAGMLVPIVPGLFVTGFAYQLMHRLIVDNGDLYLPEWDDWGRLLKEGWRLFSVYFLYELPVIVILIFGWVVYIGSFIAMTMEGGSNPNSVLPMVMLVGMGIFFLSSGLSIILGIVVSVILPPALGHTVAKDSFSAAFDFTGWWKIFKANLGGFLLAFLIIAGMVAAMYVLIQLFYMTIVLICLMFIVPMVVNFYMMLVGSALIGLAYREGVEKCSE